MEVARTSARSTARPAATCRIAVRSCRKPSRAPVCTRTSWMRTVSPWERWGRRQRTVWKASLATLAATTRQGTNTKQGTNTRLGARRPGAQSSLQIGWMCSCWVCGIFGFRLDGMLLCSPCSLARNRCILALQTYRNIPSSYKLSFTLLNCRRGNEVQKASVPVVKRPLSSVMAGTYRR
jgi:hypothetical protein